MNTISLDGMWKFKEFVGLDWVWRDSVMPKTADIRWWYDAKVPGCVMNDLLQNGQIPDPYFELNSKYSEWASARTWVYRRDFILKKEQIRGRIWLRFEGVDEECRIYLNGKLLCQNKGMFIPIQAEISSFVHEGENLLAVVIEPAPFEQPQVGKTSLTRNHKCRMTYWWDFCPRMVQQGIWGSVALRFTGEAVIKETQVISSLSSDCTQADARILVTCEGVQGKTLEVMLGGVKKSIKPVEGLNEVPFTVNKPRLWYPAGEGEQYEYSVQIRLLDETGEIEDERALLYGFKSVVWLKNKGRENNDPFLLKINGVPIFLRGYNWVPLDVMYGCADTAKLRALFALLRDAGVNLLRVWGGGLIESPAFYRLCAENGILVWQEFILSSSGIDNRTPDDPAFIEFMKAQAEKIIPCRRNETALLLWCGGNELQSDDGMPLTCEDPLLGVLDKEVKRLDPGRRFLPTSPSGGLFMNSLKNIAEHPTQLCDVHGPWEHQGLEGQRTLYNAGTCQIHSEFGVEGMANQYALERSIAPEHRMPAGKDNPVYFHRGAWWTNDQLVKEMFGDLRDEHEMRRASQYAQYEGLKYALERDRSRYPQCSAVLPWQFNEPFPNAFCTSTVDYYGQPKPAYYGVKRAYERMLPVARFNTLALAGGPLKAELGILCEKEAWTCQLTARVLTLKGKEVFMKTFYCSQALNDMIVDCAAPEGEKFLLLRLEARNALEATGNEYLFTCGQTMAGILDADGAYVTMEKTPDGIAIKNKGVTTAMFVNVLQRVPGGSGRWLRFEDNCLCLLPGESRLIRVMPADFQMNELAVEGLNLKTVK